ncbi:MAG: efflux RND transporter permease subunit, partial [Chthoniobacterales bacterium]|nr:efflux RND transporter permease subunit [Chthoniobacterales bacterium]
MLTAIVRFSLRYRGIVTALSCMLVGYGLYTLTRAKYDVFPEFAPPLVVIQTEAPGLAPEQVEVLVTQPIENAVNGVAGIESLRSGSIQGLSLITMAFDPGVDIYRARQVVAERLSAIASLLPQGVQPPALTPLTSSTSVVLTVGLSSDTRSLMDLRTIADWTVRQRLLAVPGVANVTVFGGEVRQLQIQVRPEQLIKFNVSLNDVLAAARRATGVLGAGFIENANQRIVLHTQGQSLTSGQLAATVLLHGNGGNVTLGDVAHVVDAPEPPLGAAAIGGKPGVVLVVSDQYGANTLQVTQEVEAALAELRPALAGEKITLRGDLFRPANFIQTAVGNVRSSLILGAVLVIAVLLLFLFNLRTAAISFASIPISLLAAVIVLERFGYSLDTMTLGGLAIAVGVVVDDAVIDVENILRRLRENRTVSQPRPVFQVVLDASIEVRNPVVYASFAVALVFVPILTMSGVAGRLFAPLGVAYILAVMASLLVALTLTPALCLSLLGARHLDEKEPPIVRWLKARYGAILARIERRPRTVIAAAATLTLLGLAALPFFGGGFLPELREGHFIIHMTAVPGTSLAESLRLGGRVTAELLTLPAVRSVAQRAGRAEKADDVFGTQDSEFEVDLKPLKGDAAESVLGDIRKVLARFPGVNFAVKTFLTERVEETLSGYTASVVINIYGTSLDLLDAKAQEVARVLNQVRGATEVQVQSAPGSPQLEIRLRPADLALWGFEPIDVLEAVRTAYQGAEVGQVYDGNRIFTVATILDPAERNNIAALGALPLRNGTGPYIPLRQVADIYESVGRYIILHNGARRVQTVTCNVAGRDVNSFVAAARKQIAQAVSLPQGSYIEFGGAAAAQAQSRHDLLLHSLLAGLGIILLLSVVMRGWRNLILVLVNLPFALVGGVLAVFATGGWVSIGALVGFVTLFGITLRNSIMMISHYEHLVEVEGMTWGLESAMRGASERLTPILMTALVTALGLLPLAVGAGDPGREIEGPMAIVILGGLITSTALNLLVLPTLALRYGRFTSVPQG